MASTFENDLRLEEIGTGEKSGTWGVTTNTNLELIGDAFGYAPKVLANAATDTLTVPDGTAINAEARAMYIRYSGGNQDCTVTIGPNTLSKVWFIHNGTSHTITFSQGSGANVAVAAGKLKAIATDGGGSVAKVYDITQNISIPDLFVDNTLTVAGNTDLAAVEFNSLSGTGSVTITDILDEDNMASNSPTKLSTQQSIKAYVDSQVATSDTLTEVLANGNTTATDQKIQFRDSAIYINSSVDGQLDIVSDTEIQLTAPTVDLNGNLNVSGTVDGVDIAARDAVLTSTTTTANAALPKAGGAMTGAITTNSTFDGRDVATDGTKLDGIEASADVTDTANVTAAGALMDSEVDADIKTLSLPANTTISAYGKTIIDDADASAARTTLGVAIGSNVQAYSSVLQNTTASFTTADETKLDYITVTQAVSLDQMEIDIAALENGMVYKGDWNAGSGSFPGGGSAQTGWFYYVSGAGTVNGISFTVGDNIVATTDNASTSTYANNWSKHDQTDAVQAVVGLTGSITKSGLLAALNVEDGADVTDTTNVTAAGALMDSEVDADIKTLSLPANTTISAYGKTLVDDADAATARTTLGLGTAATTAASAYATAAQGTTADAALPKAGGTLTGNVIFGDNDKAIFGNSDDFQIYHDSNNSYIHETGTGNLIIRADQFDVKTSDASQYKIRAITNGGVSLYNAGAVKLATTATGVDVTGTVTSDGMIVDGNVTFGDNDKAIFGAGSDLQVFHNGSNSYVTDSGQGKLILSTNGTSLDIYDNTNVHTMAQFTNNAGVTLSYQGSTKIATTSTGIGVTGDVTVSGTVDGRDIATNIPASLGTAGQVLTVNSGASAGEWADAGGGADLYTANESSPTAQPSATGTNAIAIGDSAISTGSRTVAFSNSRSAGWDSIAGAILNNTTSYGTTSEGNIAFGEKAKVTGSASQSIGKLSITSGSQSMGLGYTATASGLRSYAFGYGAEATGTDTVSIGRSVSSTASNQVNIGGSTQDVRISEVYTLPKVDGTNGQVLTTNGSGAVTFADAPAGYTDADARTATKVTFPEEWSTGLGLNALANVNTSSARSLTGFGRQALYRNTTGTRNTGFGLSTLYNNQTGSNNTAVGSGALVGVNGDNFSNSVALGYYAGEINKGDGNLFLGTQSGQVMDTGSNNTIVGSYNGNQNSLDLRTSSNNIVLSDGAGNVPFRIDSSSNIHVTGTIDGRDVASDGTKLDTNIPSSLGTAGQVLTVNSGGTAGEWATAGGGADLYAANESSPTAQPSATGTNSIAIGDSAISTGTNSFAGPKSRAQNSSTVALGINSNSSSYGALGNYSVAIGYQAKAANSWAISIGRDAISTQNESFAIGKSLAGGDTSFSAQITNNTSSYGATGANSVAIGKLAKATAGNAVAIGSKATASSTSAMSFCTSYANYGNVSSAANALTMGDGNSASATSAIATGYGANSTVQGKHAHANGSFGDGNAEGSAQRGTFVLRCDTTDATAEALRTSSGSASTNNQITLPNNSCYGFTGTVIARENSAQTNDFAIFEIKGGAVRAGSASTTALGTYNINKISESTGAANWSIALSADTTNGAVAITVTGEASHNIRWVATVNTTEVTY